MKNRMVLSLTSCIVMLRLFWYLWNEMKIAPRKIAPYPNTNPNPNPNPEGKFLAIFRGTIFWSRYFSNYQSKTIFQFLSKTHTWAISRFCFIDCISHAHCFTLVKHSLGCPNDDIVLFFGERNSCKEELFFCITWKRHLWTGVIRENFSVN